MSKIVRAETVGIIVARFQVPKLHKGQLALIEYVRARHKFVFIVLGDTGGERTKNDFLTFEEREYMVRQAVRRKLTIKKLHDNPISEIYWSRNLDRLIKETFPGKDAVLYGSRKSFIPKYRKWKGRSFKTHYMKEVPNLSGTAIRNAVSFPTTAAGRAAIAFAQRERNDYVYSTSDLAIINPETEMVLLIGKKHHEGYLSFVGGHTEKKDGNAANTAMREGGEEILGIDIGQAKPIASEIIFDPRYRGTNDAVMTTFLAARYLGGEPVGSDDADAGTHWVHRKNLSKVLVPWHRKLGKALNEQWGNLTAGI